MSGKKSNKKKIIQTPVSEKNYKILSAGAEHEGISIAEYSRQILYGFVDSPIKYQPPSTPDLCPDCGGIINFVGGGAVCTKCNFSERLEA